MPAKTAKQFGLMTATMKGAVTGVPKTVASEFVAKTPAKKRKKFASLLAKKSSPMGGM